MTLARSVLGADVSYLEFITESGQLAVVGALSADACMVARSCSCIDDPGGPQLLDRARIALKLLQSFLTSLGDSISGGYQSTKIMVLRQINQIVLALMNGDPGAERHALDLILSSLIVILDAEGSSGCSRPALPG